MPNKTIDELKGPYLANIERTRSPRTHATYTNAIICFKEELGNIPLTIDAYKKFLKALQTKSPATQATYRAALAGLLAFYADDDPAANLNLASIKQANKMYGKKVGVHPPHFDQDAIEKLIQYAEGLRGDIIAMRDRAFILTLVDTGLRISEACSLQRGSVDWTEQRADVTGKGDKDATVRFSRRAIDAIQDYLRDRKDGESGKPLASLPLFAQHGKSAGKKIKPIEPGGMWRSVKDRMKEAGIDRTKVRIHDFRHYFVTAVILATGNIAAAQKMARHASITTTTRYAHLDREIDEIYNEIFNK